MSYQGNWQERAACRGEDPELFFPVSEMGPGARQVAQAKAVCARCPVRAECLQYALDTGLDHGIFGGTTDAERRKLVRRTRAEAA
ncbi:WhiB family transcriptional regulator, redox-sensing transcriptional regulator [Amycolatopsis sacchari]|uniref:Transcriptional regulator WhiB n=1 Tax=Amycolatopsis sacchari TaxID=115433 RepID=A0A1I3ML37_9PSEU|nr:WhiB family transcriptional regulator [Amycolatopsis sacchari]SFI97834.1 WhiB family transcriptional regulator, redox-sensing transcriptional regulator [Amycolatopsis sacchari]